MISDENEWLYWHGRLIRYWQSLGVHIGGLVDPINGDVYTIAGLLADLEAAAKERGMTRVQYAFEYLYEISQRKKP